MSTSVALATKQSPNEYGSLLQTVQPRKIESEQDYDRFVGQLEELLEKEETEPLSLGEGYLVELLMVIVQEYEERTVSFPTASPHELLKHLMEANSLRQTDLVGVIGSSGVVSEVVNGKREISKAQAKSLGERFNVPYSLFL